MIEKVLHPRNLTKSYYQVVRNKGSAGVDKMSVYELTSFREAKGEALITSLLNRKYIPQLIFSRTPVINNQQPNFPMNNIKFLSLSFLMLLCGVVIAQKPYTAGEIQSNVEVQYGRFEMTMYSSDHSGTTSTFFLWKNGGQTSSVRWNELDIETFGKDADRWQSNPIWQYDDSDQVIKRWEGFHTGNQIANAWVKFALEWTPDYIAWFANDVEVRRIVKGENGGDGLDPVGHITDPMKMSFNHWSAFSDAWLGEFYPQNLPSYQFVDWFTYSPWNGTGFDPVSIRYDFESINEITSNFSISNHTFDDNRCDFVSDAVGVTNGMMWLGIFNAGQERAPAGSELPIVVEPIIHDIPGVIPAEEFSLQAGLQLEDVAASEGTGENIGYTDQGVYMSYDVDVTMAGDYQIAYRVASLNGGGEFKVMFDDQLVMDAVPVASTSGWQDWITVYDTVTLDAGEQILRLDVTLGGFNLYWVELTKVLVTASLGTASTEHVLSAYPNPVNSTLNLSENTSWKLLSAEGRLIKSGDGDLLDMAGIENGLYLVKADGRKIVIVKE